MYPHSLLWHYLWIAPHVLQIAIAWILLRRGYYRDFPFFLAYTIFQVLLNAVLFLLDHHPSVTWYQYRWVEWVGDVLSIVLRFAVIQEIFLIVFRSYPVLKHFGMLAYRCVVVALVVVAIAIAIHAPGVDYAPQIRVGLMVLNRAVGTVQCGLLLFLFLFSSYFGLSWRSHVFGIAAGLGIFSAVQLVISAVRSQAGVESVLLSDFLPMATYHLCVLIWLFYLLAPETVPCKTLRVPSHDVKTWSDELQHLIQR
jgi:hypothetical protein